MIEIWQKAYWLSPNGDRVQDKTRIGFSLDKPAKVTVKVRRQNERRTLVYKDELGRFVGNSSENIWTSTSEPSLWVRTPVAWRRSPRAARSL